MLKSVNDADFDAEVLASRSAVLVDFWAEWCGPCKVLAPTLDALARDYEGAVDIAKMNIDENGQARDRFAIRGIPTLALFKDGEEVARLTGVQSRAKLGAFLDAHLAREAQPVVAAEEIPRAAFGDSAEKKAAAVAGLERHISNGTCLPGPTMWDGTSGSPMGCATELPAVEDMASWLGIPSALIKAADILSTYQGTAASGCAFALAWLSAVPVGKDLSSLPRELLMHVLNGAVVRNAAADNAGLAPLHARLVALHGEDAPAEAWRDLRSDLGARFAAACSETEKMSVKCLQNASWPASDPDLLAQIIVDASLIAAASAIDALEWTQRDEAAARDLLNKAAAQLMEDQGSPQGALEQMAKADPELAGRYAAQARARQQAMSHFGQAICDVLAERTGAA